jgi:hypothetical protein
MYFYCWSCEILWEVVRDLRLCPQCHEEGVLSFIDIPNIVEIIELHAVELQPVVEQPMTTRPIVWFDTGPIEFTAQERCSDPCYICLDDITGKHSIDSHS